MKTSGGGPRSSGVAAMAVTRELGNALSLWGSRVGSMAAETGRSCSRAAVTVTEPAALRGTRIMGQGAARAGRKRTEEAQRGWRAEAEDRSLQ